jgi:hypothetical protein
MKPQPGVAIGASLGNTTAQLDPTSNATPVQLGPLKSLANRVLQRNSQRNSCATEGKNSATRSATPTGQLDAVSLEEGRVALFVSLGTQLRNSALSDDRVKCSECTNLTAAGRCRAAAKGELAGVWPKYAPAHDVLRRCECFVPRSVH